MAAMSNFLWASLMAASYLVACATGEYRWAGQVTTICILSSLSTRATRAVPPMVVHETTRACNFIVLLLMFGGFRSLAVGLPPCIEPVRCHAFLLLIARVSAVWGAETCY